MDPLSSSMLNIHTIAMVLIGITTFALGILVLRSDTQSLAYRHFLLFSVSCAVSFSATGIGLSAETPDNALRWFKIGSATAMCLPIAFYAFSSEFLKLNRSRSIRFGYAVAILLATAILSRHDLVTGVHRYWWGYGPSYGAPSVSIFGFYLAYMVAANVAYLHAYSTTTTPIKRQQIKSLLSAFILAYLALVDFIPAFEYELYPFGYLTLFLFTVVVTVIILRYQLLDSALMVSMSATYLPLVPFACVLTWLANLLSTLAPSLLTTSLVLTTTVFVVLYVTIQPRLQSAINKALFPSRSDAYNTLTRFSQAMAMNLDLANLQAEIVRTLQAVMEVGTVSLFLFDKEHGRYVVKASYGIDPAQTATIAVGNDSPLADSLLACNRPIVREEIEHGIVPHPPIPHTSLSEILGDIGAEVCLPLINKARLIGWVNLGHKPSLAFYSQDELDLLHSLANGAAIALDNAMLYEDWKRSQLLVRRADRLRSLETIAGGFAHEIRNPLTTIKTFVQLAPSRRNDPEFMDSFGAVVAEDLARIERLIDEILDYARYMKPKLSLESLNEIVSSSLQFMEVKASSLNVSIEKQLTEQLPLTMVDRQQIKQVLMNLTLNAIDAMKNEGGWLTVATRPVTRLDGTRWIQIQVSDTGCGIAPEDLPHIFDPFFTTKHESAEHAGTGLGLSIVHQIIQEHSGTIEAKSTVGQGTVFTLTLPERSDQESTESPSKPTWQGKLLPFPKLPPVLQRQTGTYDS